MKNNEITNLDYFNYKDMHKHIKECEMRQVAWNINYQPNSNYKFPTKISESHNLKTYELDNLTPFLKLSLADTLLRRKSYRVNNLTDSWSFKEVSIFFKLAFGYRDEKRNIKKDKEMISINFRTYPSGGSLYSIDVYIYVNRVVGIEKGFYKYDFLNHSLIKIYDKIGINEYENIFPMSKYKMDEDNCKVDKTSFALFLVADYTYSFVKYGKLSHRLSLLECGHMAQNAQLIATAINKKSLPLCGYFSDTVEKYLGLNKNDYEFCMYSLLFG